MEPTTPTGRPAPPAPDPWLPLTGFADLWAMCIFPWLSVRDVAKLAMTNTKVRDLMFDAVANYTSARLLVMLGRNLPQDTWAQSHRHYRSLESFLRVPGDMPWFYSPARDRVPCFRMRTIMKAHAICDDAVLRPFTTWSMPLRSRQWYPILNRAMGQAVKRLFPGFDESSSDGPFIENL